MALRESPGRTDPSEPGDAGATSSGWEKGGAVSEGLRQAVMGKIKASEWGIDMRVISPSRKLILLQHRAVDAMIPASTNKIPSALSAHLNARTPWGSMAWWIKESNNDASHRAWIAGGKTEGVRKALSTLGVDAPASWRNVDGSGLSYDNKVTATFLVDMLLKSKEQAWYGDVVKALPKGCADGTLRRSFCAGMRAGQSVHAKTGTLNGVSGVKALAGYGMTAKGNILVFATLYNGRAGTASTVGAPTIESIVKLAVEAAETSP